MCSASLLNPNWKSTLAIFNNPCIINVKQIKVTSRGSLELIEAYSQDFQSEYPYLPESWYNIADSFTKYTKKRNCDKLEIELDCLI